MTIYGLKSAYHIKLNGIPLQSHNQIKVQNEIVTLEVIHDKVTHFISQEFKGKILRKNAQWFKFYYDISQEVSETKFEKLDFIPSLDVMVWNDGYETGRLLIELGGDGN